MGQGGSTTRRDAISQPTGEKRALGEDGLISATGWAAWEMEGDGKVESWIAATSSGNYPFRFRKAPVRSNNARKQHGNSSSPIR